MKRTNYIRRPGAPGAAYFLAVAAALVMLVSAVPAFAEKGIPTEVEIGKAKILTIPATIKRVSIADPAIADVIVISPTELQLLGKKDGVTTMIVWNNSESKVFFDVIVQGTPIDVSKIKEKISEVAPDDDVKLQWVGKNTLVVTGTVSTDERKDKVHNLLLSLGSDITEKRIYHMQDGTTVEERASAGVGEKGINFVMLLDVLNPQQVLLNITVASIDRKATRELGINWAYASNKAIGVFSGVGGSTFGAAQIVQNVITSSGDTVTTVGGGDLSAAGATVGQSTATGGPQFGVLDLRNNTAYFLKALSGKGLAKILAEPKLLVKSGDTGKFTAGGEFPYTELTNVSGGSSSVTVVWKEFGVKMEFKPIVRETGQIQLNLVNAEVSNLDFANAVTVAGSRLPALKKDSVSTSVDLKDGESFVIAGLINDEWSKNLDKIPVLGDIPILGAFFRDQRMSKTERELVFLVTPTLVKPLAEKPSMPGANEPTKEQSNDLRWMPLLPTGRSLDPEQLK